MQFPQVKDGDMTPQKPQTGPHGEGSAGTGA
jgi:hypothetical protein